jgi:hypothetical protein
MVKRSFARLWFVRQRNAGQPRLWRAFCAPWWFRGRLLAGSVRLRGVANADAAATLLTLARED